MTKIGQVRRFPNISFIRKNNKKVQAASTAHLGRRASSGLIGQFTKL